LKPTLPSISVVRARASSAPTPSWMRNASPIWSPIVCSGERELIGSWKMIEIRSPRMARRSVLPGGRAARSRGGALLRGSANQMLPR
jgi:hypothetical protein